VKVEEDKEETGNELTSEFDVMKAPAATVSAAAD